MSDYSFGPFRLSGRGRRLEKAGVPLQISSRALDILIVLVERAGEIVPKQELIARVWPNIHVDEGSLRVHVAGLRKALGEGEAGARFVANVPGRGYCFVAPLNVPAAKGGDADALLKVPAPGLPARLSRMIGRDEAVEALAELLNERRFVTIVGPGGIGKTTVAVSLGHRQIPAFAGAVSFLDIGSLRDPHLVPSALASRLGLMAQEADAVPAVLRFLRDRRMLLILDSCEHVIDSAASLAERIFAEAPDVHLLATSREALRVEGEHIHPLPPLDSPPAGADRTAEDVLAFAAPQLFVDRVAATASAFELSERDAPLVAEICRRLDGIALAIELAAGRVGAHGIDGIAQLLDRRFRLLWEGRRTSLPRHQTLRATLDWSYDLLSGTERSVLARLSIMVGFFSLDAAQGVIADDATTAEEVVDAVAALVLKSLISTSNNDTRIRYRLLDTTRSYALEKLQAAGEYDAIAERHARYFWNYLEDAGAGPTSTATYVAAEQLGNVQAALGWAFQTGDARLAVPLAAAATRLFLDLSLLNECQTWSERALASLDEEMRGTAHEMTLESALGVSLMFTRGNVEQVKTSYMRALIIAEQRGDRLNQLKVLGRLHIFHERAGDFQTALVFAQRAYDLSRNLGDPVGIAAAHSMLGISHHLMGDQAGARNHLEMAIAQPQSSRLISGMYFGFHYRNRAQIALARTLWLQGYPDRAVKVAEETVGEAAHLAHPVTLCIALIWSVTVFHWIGDLQRANESIKRFIAHANRYSLAPYYAVGLGVQGELAVKRGDVEAGMAMLSQALEALHGDRYELLTTAFNITLSEGLAAVRRFRDALSVVDETIALVERKGDLVYLPELLRIKGVLLHELGAPDAAAAVRRSLDLARRQSSRGWELRSAIALSRMTPNDGVREELRKIYASFKEGFDTCDLAAARALLGSSESGEGPR